MPINPVSGEIKAQPLNDNFSYLESLLLQVNGGPIDEVATEAELNTKYPNGANGVVLVDSYLYLWSGSSWKKGSLYQSQGIARGAVDYSKLADTFDYLSVATIEENRYMVSVGSDGTINYSETKNYWLAKVSIPSTGKLRITKSNLQHGVRLVIADTNSKSIGYWGYQFGEGLFNYAWIDDYSSFYEIDTEQLLKVYTNAVKIFLSFRIEDRQTAYITGNKTADLTEKDWVATQKFSSLQDIPNRLSDKYDLLKEETSSFHPNKSIANYNTETGLPNLSTVTNRSVWYYDLPLKGLLRFPRYNLPDQQFLLLVNDQGKIFHNLDYRYNQGTVTKKWLTLSSDDFTIDLLELKKEYPNCFGFWQVVWNKAVAEFYVSAKDAIPINDVFEFALKEQTEKELVLVNQYPIVLGETGYIYLDNINLNGNYYADKDVFVSQTANNTLLAGGYPILMAQEDVQVPIQRIYENSVIENGTITCKTVPKTAGAGQTANVMLIGESTTEYGWYRNALLNKFVDDSLTVNFVGTRGEGATKHEGRSGWATGHLVNAESYNGVTNSFWNPSTSKFDYAYYRQQYPDVPVPDIILLSFGINDPGQGVSPIRTVENLTYIINNIRSIVPNVKIAVGLTSNLCRIENVAYRTESRRNNILRTIREIRDTFQNRESEGLYINPMYLTVDPIFDMQYEERPISIYQDKTELFCIDGTHPSQIGFNKMADCSYNIIKYMMR